MVKQFKLMFLVIGITVASFSFGQYHCGEPNWSADGNRVVFVGGDASENVEGKYPIARNIMIIDTDGSNKKQLTTNATYANEYPALSPDGKTILFSSNRDGIWKFYSVHVTGTNEQALNMESTSSVWNDPCRAVWSPDGKQFCFPKTINNQRILHIANRDGSNSRAISDVSGIYPDWSPDGKSLAFYRKGNIHLVDIDGTHYRQLTNNNDPASYESRPIYPRWSIDGKFIYYIKGDHIFKVNTDGSNETQLTTTSGQKWYLGVSPKNRIIYGAIEDKRDRLYICNLDGSDLKCITK